MTLLIPFVSLTVHGKTVAPRHRRYWRDCRNLRSSLSYKKVFPHAGCTSTRSPDDVANSPPNCSPRSHPGQSTGCRPADIPQSCPLTKGNAYKPAAPYRYPGSVSSINPYTPLQNNRPPASHAHCFRSEVPTWDKLA